MTDPSIQFESSMIIPSEQITGLILAGGRGMRMGQVNKGLQNFRGIPMVEHVISRLQPQVSQLVINANQDLERYKQFGFPTVTDDIEGYAGPLAGIHAGLTHCKTDYLVTAPCDSPFLPQDLVSRLSHDMLKYDAQLCVVTCKDTSGESQQIQAQAVFSLIETNLAANLEDFLKNGGRKVSDWYSCLRMREVYFDDAQCFRNINTLAEIALYTD